MSFRVTDSRTFVYGVQEITHEVSDTGRGFQHRLVLKEHEHVYEGDPVPYRSIASCNEWKACTDFYFGSMPTEHPFKLTMADRKVWADEYINRKP